jgi:hypothetical protein
MEQILMAVHCASPRQNLVLIALLALSLLAAETVAEDAFNRI